MPNGTPGLGPRQRAILLWLASDRATPLLDEIRVKIETAQGRALPASALGKACRYAVTLWEKLTRFLESPDPELSNNLAENSMRPVALTKGRPNEVQPVSIITAEAALNCPLMLTSAKSRNSGLNAISG